MRQYEIIYVLLADERDAIGLRAQVRGDDVYVYRVQATRLRSATCSWMSLIG
ncbi:MAG: hypothetical protein U0935_12985 [Pirellulales bacterium]